MKTCLEYFSPIAFLVLVAAIAPLSAEDAKPPKHSIKEVMKEVHKGDDNIGKRASNGAASAEDLAKMVELYESLPTCEPPRGDKASWAAKTEKLLTAAKAMKAGAPNAVDQYKQASNCKACHSEHKPEEKK